MSPTLAHDVQKYARLGTGLASASTTVPGLVAAQPRHTFQNVCDFVLVCARTRRDRYDVPLCGRNDLDY